MNKILGRLTMTRQTREQLLTGLNQALRKVSAQSVLLSASVARLAGLNSTDLECLDLLLLSGPTTAGALAAHTGLTTGAITAVIDRMERAGFARRHRDPRDRRRVLVEALPRYVQEIGQLYRPLAQSTEQLHREYDDRQLTVVVDYLTRAFGLAAEHVNWLQTQRPLARRASARKPRRAPAPRTAAPPAAASQPLSERLGGVPRARTTGQTSKWSRIASSDSERSRARR
jgi:DNA-binding MarR family transcriptional regulator